MQNNYKQIIDKIYYDILNKMRNDNYKVDHILPKRWISLTYFFTLNPNEQLYLNDAINKLINDGLVYYTEKGIGGIALTQKGFNFIYSQYF